MRHIFPLRGIWEGDILCFKRISESALLIYKHLNCLLRRGKRQEARGNSKGIGGDSANLKNKCFKCVLA
ncbi:MAG: hypothetical protein EWV62_16660 [Microcystis aeruginosa Ma_OC_LR_19540900_S633]|nr:MAG: hypothetical protein EWV62_16660 [Microcystis aeruginosa Ma_OC_LR_19540900_S633]